MGINYYPNVLKNTKERGFPLFPLKPKPLNKRSEPATGKALRVIASVIIKGFDRNYQRVCPLLSRVLPVIIKTGTNYIE